MALPLKPKRLIQNGLVAHYAPIRQRNLLKWSDDFSNSVWIKSAVTIIQDSVTAPNGTQTADKIVESAIDTFHTVNIGFNAIDNSNYVLSVYLKANERIFTRLAIVRKDGTAIRAWFNLNTGTIGTVESGATAYISDVGNGWYRCSLKFNILSGVTTPSLLISPTINDNISSYLGDITKSIYIWGAQLELSTQTTTYQRTTDLQTLWNQKQENMNVTNIVTNGNFANGISGWTLYNGTASINNNILTLTGTGGSLLPILEQIQNTSVTPIIGHKIYGKIKFKVTNSVCLSVAFQIDGSTGGTNASMVSISNPVQNNQYSSGGITTVGADFTGNIRFVLYHQYADAATALNKVMEVQQVMAIDLTSLFGAGNEPTVQQCDEMFSWFDGSIRMNLNRYNGMLGSTSGADATDPVFIGDSLKFDGVDDYIEIPNSEAINISSSFYIEFVFKASIASGYLLSKNLSTVTDVQYGIYWHGTNKSVVGVVNGVARGASNNDSIPVNTWTHVGFYYDKQNIKYYINGILSGTPFPYTDAIIQSSNTLNIGRRKSSAYLTGEIAQINIYNRALTDVERTINYNYLKQIMNIRGIII